MYVEFLQTHAKLLQTPVGRRRIDPSRGDSPQVRITGVASQIEAHAQKGRAIRIANHLNAWVRSGGAVRVVGLHKERRLGHVQPVVARDEGGGAAAGKG